MKLLGGNFFAKVFGANLVVLTIDTMKGTATEKDGAGSFCATDARLFSKMKGCTGHNRVFGHLTNSQLPRIRKGFWPLTRTVSGAINTSGHFQEPHRLRCGKRHRKQLREYTGQKFRSQQYGELSVSFCRRLWRRRL